MAIHMDPVLGNWYRDAEDRYLQVTGLSGHQGEVEISYLDGAVEQFPLEVWDDLSLRPVDGPPERRHEPRLTDEEYRQATGWGEKSPDDFPGRG